VKDTAISTPKIVSEARSVGSSTGARFLERSLDMVQLTDGPD
jgi:hypothetical protein